MGFLVGFLIGFITVFVLFIVRMLSSPRFDSSNLINAIRVLAHALIHPDDFAYMYYMVELPANDKRGGPVQLGSSIIYWLERPFWYINKDEFAEVVKTRAPK